MVGLGVSLVIPWNFVVRIWVVLDLHAPRPDSVVVERSPGMREVWWFDPRPRQTKDVKI